MKMIFQYNKRIRICALLEILEIDPGSEYLSRGSDLEFGQQEKDAKDKINIGYSYSKSNLYMNNMTKVHALPETGNSPCA